MKKNSTDGIEKPSIVWRDTNLADMSLQGIPLILADIILVNHIPFLKTLPVCQFTLNC